ncbi:mitogen-activated protein kinase 15 isoform X2 [Heterocephalus glaber]|uniref:Mitogen-activated protein kinase 15 n=1 Tax=Heterocephalus glaber TaxID=10181 RepID=A0AAX6NVK0_HETGA|nr:mitogen-activated protein kinase 15 isoform X2 [Heterocephalus glaber]
MCAAEVDSHVAQRYMLRRRLGKGAYGIVWKAVDRRTGEVVAIKKIFDAFRDKTDAQRTFREIMLLQEFGDHPNIIRLLDVIRAENDRDIYLVFESMDTDLNAVIQKGNLLEDIHKRYIFYQLLQATKFIHLGHVIHRDQKPSNVLLDANCSVKLCDFGLARSLSNLPEGPEGQALTEYVATRWYRAPEVLLSSSRYTLGVDMWSLGCILGEMLRGQPLFPGSSTLHQLELILETIPPPSAEDLLALGSGYSDLILHRLGSGPRQTLDALLPPDTPPEALDLLRQLLVFAPDKRLSAAQALKHPYVQRFHCPYREWTRGVDVQHPVHEGDQLSASEYRSRLYQMILEQRGNSHGPRKEGVGGVTSGTEPRASCGQGHLIKPQVNPQLPIGAPARNPGPRPQNSLGQDPENGVPSPEAPSAARNIPRQRSAFSLQPQAPGRGDRPPLRVKPSVRGMVPSLTMQAAAQVANQVLIRGNPTRRALWGSPGSPRAPTWPEDVHLSLMGGPGQCQGFARGLLPGLWNRVSLSAGPPASAPWTPWVSCLPTSHFLS